MPTGEGQTEKTFDSRIKKTTGKAASNKREKKVLKIPASETIINKPLEGADPDELVFAFDIGTRTVVGVVGIQEDDTFRVITTEVVAHKCRAMLDGQIHDIEQVASAAKEVKERIEARLGISLKKVAIAAAGRVLKTCQVRVDREVEAGMEIDQELVGSLEIEGIQRAQMMLDSDESSEDMTQFYCVGYSVINYYLNGYIISKLTGHKGKSAGADILATFLPHIVVDSLYTVMDRVGLEVASLTLEPIAAINVTIPSDLRLLNLALVDIGAGTSDIALTKDGSVIAYAMAPLAGDEITERISQHYLVDFNTGEKIKLSLSSKRENINFTDILKKKHSIKTSEVLEVIKPVIEMLAATISQKILEYNCKAPNAVFLIGGGSQIPGLAEKISVHLDLPAERVAVRGRDVIRSISFSDKKLSGPESITPYGIAVTAQMQKGRDFLTVSINGKKIKLFNSKELNISDALILVGFNPGELIGRTGKSIVFSLNGEKKLIRGEPGNAAEIYANNVPANLETVLKFGDSITVVPAQDGKNAQVKVADVVDRFVMGKVTVNGSIIDISTNISINGTNVSPDCNIKNGDSVVIYEIRTLRELLKACGVDNDNNRILVNGEELKLDYILKDADRIEYSEKKRESEVTLPGQTKAEINSPDTLKVYVNGSEIRLKESKTQFIFVDIFNYIDFDLTKPNGNIMLRLNGHPAAFTDIITSGDKIEIYWQKY